MRTTSSPNVMCVELVSCVWVPGAQPSGSYAMLRYEMLRYGLRNAYYVSFCVQFLCALGVRPPDVYSTFFCALGSFAHWSTARLRDPPTGAFGPSKHYIPQQPTHGISWCDGGPAVGATDRFL